MEFVKKVKKIARADSDRVLLDTWWFSLYVVFVDGCYPHFLYFHTIPLEM